MAGRRWRRGRRTEDGRQVHVLTFQARASLAADDLVRRTGGDPALMDRFAASEVAYDWTVNPCSMFSREGQQEPEDDDFWSLMDVLAEFADPETWSS